MLTTKNYSLRLIQAILATTSFALLTTATAQQQLQELRNRTILSLLPNPSTLNASILDANKVATLLSVDGSWADINYSDVSANAHDHWEPAAHLSRLNTMAAPLVACDLPGNFLCNSSTLATKCLAALRFWLTRNSCSQNWWFNQINAPGLSP